MYGSQESQEARSEVPSISYDGPAQPSPAKPSKDKAAKGRSPHKGIKQKVSLDEQPTGDTPGFAPGALDMPEPQLDTNWAVDQMPTYEDAEVQERASIEPKGEVQHENCMDSQCPNIIMMLTDDHGFTDMGKHIDKNVETPTLDRLVREGVRFSFGYASAPQCVPSRAGLLSGRDQNMFGLYENRADAGYGVDTLPPREKVMTIAEHVHRLGYKTGMSGKWHLGSNSDLETNPGGRGFDEYMVGTTGHFYMNVDDDGNLLANPKSDTEGTKESGHDSPKVRLRYDKRNRIDVTAEFAQRFVQRHAEHPFFYYWAPYGPHQPMVDDDDPYLPSIAMEKYEFMTEVENDARRRGLALVKAIDTNIDRIFTVLGEHRLEARTLVLFSSDNGAPMQLSYDEKTDYHRMSHPSHIPPHGVYDHSAYVGSENVPLRGAKQSVWEGGIRVPMLAYWKGKFQPGTVVDDVVTTLDLTATMAHAAGMNERPGGHFHGTSLLDKLTGKTDTVERGSEGYKHHFYWYGTIGDIALRIGHWKLRKCGEQTFLFNITADPSELVNRAEASPDWVAKLNEIVNHWLDRLPFKPSKCSSIDHFVRPADHQCPEKYVDPRFRLQHRIPYVDDSEETTLCWPAEVREWDNSIMGLSRTWHWNGSASMPERRTNFAAMSSDSPEPETQSESDEPASEGGWHWPWESVPENDTPAKHAPATHAPAHASKATAQQKPALAESKNSTDSPELAAIKDGLLDAIENGRSKKTNDGFDHSHLDVEPLRWSIQSLKDFRNESNGCEGCDDLLARAANALSIREALMAADPYSGSSWNRLARVLGSLTEDELTIVGEEAALAAEELRGVEERLARNRANAHGVTGAHGVGGNSRYSPGESV